MALEKACDYFNKKYGTNYVSPMGSLFSNKELNINLNLGNEVNSMINEFPNDFHGGWIETSMMLDISPEKVSSNYLQINDIEVSEKDMIYPSRYSKKTKNIGHLGYPRLSKLSLGIDSITQQRNILWILWRRLLTNVILRFINTISYIKYLYWGYLLKIQNYISITGDSIDKKENLYLLDKFLEGIDQDIMKYAVLGNWEHWSSLDINELNRVINKWWKGNNNRGRNYIFMEPMT